MMALKLLYFIALIGSIFCLRCRLSNNLKSEIRDYAGIVEKIKKTVVDANGSLTGSTYQKLANFVDDFGSRIAGSQNLENAIDFMLQEMQAEGLDNVHGENAPVPHWVRGQESAELRIPRLLKIPILGLGGSVGTTGTEGITAEAIVVRSFDELKNLVPETVAGKIVVYNEVYVSYDETVQYRSRGATEAAKLGAVAVLIRSITPFSIGSPHTGQQHYDENVPKIPTACITIEHAEMFHRLYNRGIKLVINIKMEAKSLPMAISRNIIAEIKGRSDPHNVVLVSGHIDSWDVGQGAMDDGGGAFIAWRSLVVLKKLGLQPKRTIRCVLWTGEEEGLWGAVSYMKNHENEIRNMSIVMESDEGTFTPTGLEYYGPKNAACVLKEILKLMKPLNTTIFEQFKYPVGSDISLWQEKGVPGASLRNKNKKYFWYHHSEGDMMTVENSHDLDLSTALWASAAYIIADMSVNLPKQHVVKNQKTMYGY